MIDAKKQLLELLDDLSVNLVYELFITPATALPCVGYMQASDSSEYEGDTVRYSRVSFLIKIYSNFIDEVETISQEVDDKLSPFFNRSGGNEFTLNDIIVKNFIYTSKSIYENRRS